MKYELPMQVLFDVTQVKAGPADFFHFSLSRGPWNSYISGTSVSRNEMFRS